MREPEPGSGGVAADLLYNAYYWWPDQMCVLDLVGDDAEDDVEDDAEDDVEES